MPDVSHLDFLAGGGEQPLGPAEVEVCPARGAAREMYQRPRGQRPGPPDGIVGRAQYPDGATQIIKCLMVPPEHPQRDAAPDQDVPVPRPGGQHEGRVECGDPPAAAALVDQGYAKRREHVSLTVGRARSPRQAQRAPKFTGARVQVAPFAEQDAERLVRLRGLVRRRIAGQNLASPGLRPSWVDWNQKQRVQHLAGRGAALIGSGPHGMHVKPGQVDGPLPY